jgi:hypothetical protein
MNKTLSSRHEEEIQKIKSSMTCHKNFKCLDSGFCKICQVTDIGMEDHVKCLSDEANTCLYAVSFGYSFFCRCPLRLFAAKKLGK